MFVALRQSLYSTLCHSLSGKFQLRGSEPTSVLPCVKDRAKVLYQPIAVNRLTPVAEIILHRHEVNVDISPI